jgi:hypothetical protein
LHGPVDCLKRADRAGQDDAVIGGADLDRFAGKDLAQAFAQFGDVRHDLDFDVGDQRALGGEKRHRRAARRAAQDVDRPFRQRRDIGDGRVGDRKLGEEHVAFDDHGPVHRNPQRGRSRTFQYAQGLGRCRRYLRKDRSKPYGCCGQESCHTHDDPASMPLFGRCPDGRPFCPQ